MQLSFRLQASESTHVGSLACDPASAVTPFFFWSYNLVRSCTYNWQVPTMPFFFFFPAFFSKAGVWHLLSISLLHDKMQRLPRTGRLHAGQNGQARPPVWNIHHATPEFRYQEEPKVTRGTTSGTSTPWASSKPSRIEIISAMITKIYTRIYP